MNVLKSILLCALAAAPASARHFDAWEMGKDVPHVDIRVAPGETMADKIATSGSVSIEGTATEKVADFGGPVSISGSALDDVASFGGPITIDGSVKGDVASFGGGITINGEVDGDVASTGGDVTLGPKAVISGDLALLGGKLQKADGAVIRGSISNVDSKLAARLAMMGARWKNWEPDVRKDLGVAGRVALFAGFLALTICIGLLVVLADVLLPKPVDAVAQSVKTDFWNAAGIGVLMLLCFGPSLVLLAVSILGIPLIPLAFVAAAAAGVLALAAASRLAGERLFESLEKPLPGRASAAAAGYGLLVGILVCGKVLRLAGGFVAFAGGTLVLAGLMVLCAAFVVGLGGVWRTRMGSRAA